MLIYCCLFYTGLQFQIIINSSKMSTIEEVLNKLQKLKQQATAAPDILSLEKISNKINKIREKLSDYRNNKQLFGILDKIDMLIKEKNKYFRQVIIKNSSKFIKDESMRNEEADKTLKYSKSAENVKLVPSRKTLDSLRKNDETMVESPKNNGQSIQTSVLQDYKTRKNTQKTTHVRSAREQKQQQNQQMSEILETSSAFLPSQAPQMVSKRNIKSLIGGSSLKNITKNRDDHEDAQATTVNYNYSRKNALEEQTKQHLHGQINQLQEKLSYSMKQIEDLSKKIVSLQNNKQKQNNLDKEVKHTSPKSKIYLMKQQQIVDDYSRKLREKAFIIEDLKAKLQYYKSTNQELKNKIINEQRRNQDYCGELRSQIKSLKKQIERTKKQNDSLSNDIEDLQQKNQSLVNEVKKLITKLQQESKEKENIRKALTSSASAKSKQFERQISKLTNQLMALSKVQINYQRELQQKQQHKVFIEKLQKRIQQLQNECKSLREERDQSQLETYKLQEQQKYLKSELRLNIQAKEILAQQLLQAKQKLQEQSRVTNLLQYQSELKQKNKLSKLREIKGLLSQLR